MGCYEGTRNVNHITCSRHFFTNINVYHNAYFRKNENKQGYSWLFLFVGLFNLYGTYQTFLFQPEEIINGNINRGVIQLSCLCLFR